MAVRGADKPCPDCGGSVCLGKKNVGQKYTPPGPATEPQRLIY